MLGTHAHRLKTRLLNEEIGAAVAIERRASALVSADHAFGGITDLAWVNLGAPDLEERLTA